MNLSTLNHVHMKFLKKYIKDYTERKLKGNARARHLHVPYGLGNKRLENTNDQAFHKYHYLHQLGFYQIKQTMLLHFSSDYILDMREQSM